MLFETPPLAVVSFLDLILMRPVCFQNPPSKGLELVLSQDAAPVEDNVTVVCDEEEGTALVTTVEEFSSPSFYTGSTLLNRYKWLLANLPTLPHFDSVRTTCCFALRQVSWH